MSRGDIPAARVDVRIDRQNDAEEDASGKTGEEERAYGHAACRDRVDNEVVARRDEHALNCGGTGKAGGIFTAEALGLHQLYLYRAERRDVSGRGAGDAAEEHGCKHVDHCRAAVHPSDKLIGKLYKSVAYTALVYQLAAEDEERHGHEREVVHAADGVLYDEGEGQLEVGVCNYGGDAHRHGHADAQEKQNEENTDQQGHGYCFGTHQAFSSFLRLSSWNFTNISMQ